LSPLWVTVDPIGTAPLYLSVTKDLPTSARKKAAMRATLIAFMILAGFLYLGQYLLEVMHRNVVVSDRWRHRAVPLCPVHDF
jgi:small neutral amino acid transporter SnatA (MarC family)